MILFFMKTIKIKKTVKIPGTNLILERGDKVLYQTPKNLKESVDKKDAGVIENKYGTEALELANNLDSAGFSDFGEFTSSGYVATYEDPTVFTCLINKEGFEIRLGYDTIYKGKTTKDIPKGLATMKKLAKKAEVAEILKDNYFEWVFQDTWDNSNGISAYLSDRSITLEFYTGDDIEVSFDKFIDDPDRFLNNESEEDDYY